jgi:hypothetical protein
MKNRLIIIILLGFIPILIEAQTSETEPSPQLVFELPLLDIPYQLDAAKTVNEGNVTIGSFFKGYANPGMHLSLALSSDLYTGAHFGINKIFKVTPETKRRDWTFGKRFLFALTLGGADFVLTYAPGFGGWEHEEYHRAVMSRFHVNSFNDMNKFPIGSELISVNHVLDEDLIRFKQESPSDFIRMHVSGIEGEYLLIDKLQRNNFFYGQNLPHEFLYLFSTINSISYVQVCSDPKEANSITEELNEIETDIPVRDFTGLDFLGWTYDLFRPEEPYNERGIHPTGVGIDRYIKTTDLNPDELSYLEKQGKLQWLNTISPMLIGFKSIRLTNNGLYGNFSVHHYLTSFGNDISLNIFLKCSRFKSVFAFHSYQNYYKSFPAIEANLVDYEIPIFSNSLFISPRLLLGIQPQNQEFKTNSSAFLGLAECKLEFETKSFIHPFIELSAKTNGWVAGNEFLNSNFSCRMGVVSRFLIKE